MRWLTLGLLVLTTATTTAATRSADDDPVISVREASPGVFVVEARFTVPESAAIAREVLTDYAAIARFMPNVRLSRVVSRTDDTAVVEQEAVSHFLMFSKKVHLVLHVEEGADTLRFSDRCRESFARYDGSWTIEPRDDRTQLTYELAAEPTFSVPGMVLRRLLRRDADEMIEGLRMEMRARAARQG